MIMYGGDVIKAKGANVFTGHTLAFTQLTLFFVLESKFKTRFSYLR